MLFQVQYGMELDGRAGPGLRPENVRQGNIRQEGGRHELVDLLRDDSSDDDDDFFLHGPSK